MEQTLFEPKAPLGKFMVVQRDRAGERPDVTIDTLDTMELAFEIADPFNTEKQRYMRDAYIVVDSVGTILGHEHLGFQELD